MTKYIKGKDGKFAGSIGAGKADVPTPPPAVVVPSSPAPSINNPERNIFLAEYCFGTNVAEPEAFDTSADWADGVATAITDQPLETFKERFLPSAQISLEANDHYVFYLYNDGDDTESNLTYFARGNNAWVETYVAETGDFAASGNLPQEYANAIKAEIKRRSK